MGGLLYSTMGDLIKKIDYVTPRWYKILMWTNVVIFLIGFFIPPIGHVDPTALQGLSIITVGGLFGLIPYYLQYGKSVKLTKGDASISINSNDNDYSE